MPVESFDHWSFVAPPLSLGHLCSRHFRWRALVQCGPTAAALMANGDTVVGPLLTESWRMLAGLAQMVLDPVVDEFGTLQLTYGFAGPALTKHIRGCIAPHLDQHAAHETNKTGSPICRRGGAAADFRLVGRSSRAVADWIIAHLSVDRLYFYGPRRSLHVSWQPAPLGRYWSMVKSPSGRLLPRPYGVWRGTK